MASLDHQLTDGVVTVRPFDVADRNALVEGRDLEFHRFMGEGSPEPAPVGCICVDVTVVGWVDFDAPRHWLEDREVNVGYNVFAEHRGNGYGALALQLLCRYLAKLDSALRPTLLIDPENYPSLAVAARAGFEFVGEVDGQYLFKLPRLDR